VRRLIVGTLVAASLSLLAASSASADFGLREVGADFTGAGVGPAAAAGSHPDEFTTSFELNTVVDGSEEALDGELRNLVIAQIPGFVGSQVGIPRCSSAAFNHRVEGRASCPDPTALGIAAVKGDFGPIPVGSDEFIHVPVYDLAPSPGEAAKLGFVALNVPIVIDVEVSQKPPYELVARLNDSPQSIQLYGSEVTLWGNPESPAHDSLRGGCVGEPVVSTPAPVSLGSCPVTAPERAFLTLPRACAGPLATVFAASDWTMPPGILTAPKSPAEPFVASDCAGLGFDPTIASGGSDPAGDSPSGLDFDLEVDDPGLSDPGGRADSDIERAAVTLPEGFTTNPAVAGGLGACSLAQYEAEALRFDPAVGCPQSSDVGSVEVTSPLLEEKVDGQIYVAKQGQNVFGSLLALYMVLRNEANGILIKQPIRVDPDSATGRLATTVSGIPQLPFSDFHLHFRDGPRAPLITPATCGTYRVAAQLFPYADPAAPLAATATLSVTAGAGGGPCVSDPARLPNAPSFSAGTLDPTAGSYSPFRLDLVRADGSQRLASIATTLPPGLLGKLAGILYCPESGNAGAGARSREGDGALELATPSCPPASEVGTVRVGAGAGPDPFYVTGRAYLAGPYAGAPLSLEIITPAIAGPFDLGVVAVRTALRVDPRTAQITAVSDPIPTILHGLPLDVRSIAIDMNRPNFTLNPTSCEPMSVLGSATSVAGSTALVSQYFQAANCTALRFEPKLALSLKGATRRSGHPALRAVVTYPHGGAYANIARAVVGLPHSEFLDQGNLGGVCTQPQLKSATCPKKSIYGRARAWSPLLDKPLEGPVYLGVGFGHKLPDLVADLGGQIRILLNGRIDTDPQGGIRNTFEAVPDAPVSKFVLELKGGPKRGLLENSENICSEVQRATADFVAHNGRRVGLRPLIANSCAKKKHRR
jgi:hypothetical protein